MNDANSPEKSDAEKATPTTVDTDTAAVVNDTSKPQLEIESDIKDK